MHGLRPVASIHSITAMRCALLPLFGRGSEGDWRKVGTVEAKNDSNPTPG